MTLRRIVVTLQFFVYFLCSSSLAARRQAKPAVPIVERVMAKGFTLCMVEAVMTGRAGKVLDLMCINLWR